MDPLEDKLSSFLKTGPDWTRLKTSFPGVFVLRLPPFRGIPARLAIELNPMDDVGNPTKRRGLILRDEGELAEYARIFGSDKLKPLLAGVAAVNPPEGRRRAAKPGEDVLEI
jgi:hypothetical protein